MEHNYNYHEIFVKFLEAPTREKLREVIQHNLGETDNLDFKSEWTEYTKIARHILALSNSGGGALIFGVEENNDGSLNPKGLPSNKDKAEISSNLSKYFPHDDLWQVHNFDLSASEYSKIKGDNFQVLIVNSDETKIPILSKKGGTGISPNAIYIRSGTESKEADKDQLERLINRRIESGYSSQKRLNIAEHLDQLEELYLRKKREYLTGSSGAFESLVLGSMLKTMHEDTLMDLYPGNNKHPDYYVFIEELIEKKQERINQELGLEP